MRNMEPDARFVVGLLIFIILLYGFALYQEQKTCECKCFDAGYLQACEDFENMLETPR